MTTRQLIALVVAVGLVLAGALYLFFERSQDSARIEEEILRYHQDELRRARDEAARDGGTRDEAARDGGTRDGGGAIHDGAAPTGSCGCVPGDPLCTCL